MVWEEHVIEGRIGGGCGGFRRYEVSAGVSRPRSFTEELECIPTLLIQLLQLYFFPLDLKSHVPFDLIKVLNYTLTLNPIHIGNVMM